MSAPRVLLIISGGIAERMKFWPQCLATVALVGIVYPLFEGLILLLAVSLGAARVFRVRNRLSLFT